MKKLLIFLAALFGLSLAIAQTSSGTGPDCGWYFGANANKSGPYRTPEGACQAFLSAMPEVNLPNNQGTTKWQYHSINKFVPDKTRDARTCYGTLPGIFNTPQAMGEVYSSCLTPPDDFCKAKKDVVIKRIFQWLDNPGDNYDLYKIPENIAFDNCEYARTKKVTISAKAKTCKYSATVDYVGTGLARDKPAFADVPENCSGDPDPGEDDEVTPDAFPAIRDLYEPEYPDGLTGVVNDTVAKLKQSPFFGLIAKLTARFTSVGGVCDSSWNFDLNFGGFLNMGAHTLTIDCGLFTALRAILVLSALIAARRIIFGG